MPLDDISAQKDKKKAEKYKKKWFQSGYYYQFIRVLLGAVPPLSSGTKNTATQKGKQAWRNPILHKGFENHQLKIHAIGNF